MILLLASSVFLLIQASSPAFGVASISSAGDACVAMPGPRLAAGSIVTLVEPNQPQSVVTAVVDRSVASCDDLNVATMMEGPYYRLRELSPTPRERPVWIALPGRIVSREIPGAQISLRLGEKYPNVRVRLCTSREGFHLTAWAGEPLETRRLWHQYYYLGYDVEPSCTEKEVSRDVPDAYEELLATLRALRDSTATATDHEPELTAWHSRRPRSHEGHEDILGRRRAVWP
jgi:hypothetical protein